MANVLYFSPRHEGSVINDANGDRARADADGYIEVDPTDTGLIAAIEEAGGIRVDREGSSEAITDGTVQTATTMSACQIFNGASETVLEIRNKDAAGTLLAGPFTIAANAERIFVFPVALSAPDGIFFSTTTGALATTDGILIP